VDPFGEIAPAAPFHRTLRGVIELELSGNFWIIRGSLSLPKDDLCYLKVAFQNCMLKYIPNP
jgi:hypothetical protein